MSLSPNPSALRRKIDQNYANKQRDSSLKWIFVNGILFVLFTYDLCCKCSWHTSALHYVEGLLAAALLANTILHASRLWPSYDAPPSPAQKAPSSPYQSESSSYLSRSGSAWQSWADLSDEDLSVGVSRWRGTEPGSSPPRADHSPPAPSPRSPADHFISDHHALTEFLKQMEAEGEESPASGWGAAGGAAGAGAWGARAPHYQLALRPAESSLPEEDSGVSAQEWWRLDLEPHRLTQWEINLRTWIHLTILQRLVREMDLLDETFAKHGLTDMRIGQVSVDRLRAACGISGAESLPAVIAFLEPYGDQKYVAQRIKELAAGGCLREYKWDGGGRGWTGREGQPADAELVLHLFATYLDVQAAGGAGRGARTFSAAHLADDKQQAANAPGTALKVVRVRSRPPHYIVWGAKGGVEAGRGRGNLLRCLLLLLAAAARATPPALARMHLGPHHLNMLWILSK